MGPTAGEDHVKIWYVAMVTCLKHVQVSNKDSWDWFKYQWCQTSCDRGFFCENSYHYLAVNYFCKKVTL